MVQIIDNGQAHTVVVERRTSVATTTKVASTVQVSSQGPQGPQGAPGPEGGSSEARIADGTLGGHRIVRSAGDDLVGYADSTNPSHGDDTQGMTLGAADDGETVQVQRIGSVTYNGWSWTQGTPVFLGANGLPTQTPPSPDNGDAFSQVIGHAEAPTVLYLSIEPPVYF